MPMILFFDTETTGLIPGRIIQLSYVMQSETATTAKNFFFAVEYVFKRHIPPWRHRVQTRRYLRCHSLGLRKL